VGITVYRNHRDSINNIVDKLRRNDEILSIIVTGSIAHGFETENSDINLMMIISNDSYARLLRTESLYYYDKECCTYEGGHIEGKFICVDYIEKVAKQGSEPAKFAFDGAFPVFTRIQNVDKLLKKASRYPLDQKEEKIKRFYAHFEAWKQYYNDAVAKGNKYLMNTAASNLVLFGGRLLLTYNETLYPGHKWFITVLKDLQHKPEGLLDNINNILEEPIIENVENFYQSIKNFNSWDENIISWENQFLLDNEFICLNGSSSINDI
jgi:hypothetical protein